MNGRVNKILFLDIDGVCINLLCGLQKYFERRGKKFKVKRIKTYDFQGRIGVEPAEVYEALKTREPYELAEWYDFNIRDLHQVMREYAIIPYTSVPDVAKQIRLDQLHELGFRTLNMNGIWSGKKKIPDLSRFKGRYVYLVEDDPEMIKEWAQLPETALIFAINHTYNSKPVIEMQKEHKHILLALSFQNVLDFLLGRIKPSKGGILL